MPVWMLLSQSWSGVSPLGDEMTSVRIPKKALRDREI